MNILALDPATKCGWAYRDGSQVSSGTWDLSVRRDESAGMRLIRLRSKLREFAGVDLVVFEAARHAAPKMQGALAVQSQLQSVIVVHCEDLKADGYDLEYRGYSPSEIKKYATGAGNANKEAVVAAALLHWPNQVINDDNQADALMLLALAASEYDERYGADLVPDVAGSPLSSSSSTPAGSATDEEESPAASNRTDSAKSAAAEEAAPDAFADCTRSQTSSGQ